MIIGREFLLKFEVDIALIDGTFWSSDELSGRFQHEVPHPPVSQTLEMLGSKNQGDPDIFFIHLNHTNPLYFDGAERKMLLEIVELLENQLLFLQGYKVANIVCHYNLS